MKLNATMKWVWLRHIRPERNPWPCAVSARGERSGLGRFSLAPWIVFPLAALLMAGGCAGIGDPPAQVRHYAPEYEPPIVLVEKRLPFVVRVDRFAESPFYDTTELVYSEAPFRRDAYNYHKWRASPGDMIAHFLARDMDHAGMFAGVFVFDRALPATHVAQGAVEEFYEMDNPDGWRAVLSFRVSLLAAGEPDVSRRILFQKRYSHSEPCHARTPESVAAAMSRALATLSRSVLIDLYRALADTTAAGRKIP